MTSEATSRRKDEHLDLVRTRDVSSLRDAGWDSVEIPHVALPETDFASVSLETKFLGRDFAAPLLISSMTGGSPEGERLNRELAAFAERRRLPMGVGSQRVQLEKRDGGLFDLRKTAPKAALYANLGIVQFNYGVTADDAVWLVEKLEAQALILHANVLQEAIQFEGDRNFAGLLAKIPALKKRLPVPLILKETGCGLDVATCRRAVDAGFDALDVAGLGGTHWGFLEGLRHEQRRALGDMFRGWGVPTARAVTEARTALPRVPLVASGGVRHGLDAARALYLGADLVGLAAPFLKAAVNGAEALDRFLDLQVEALRIALFCGGQTSPRGWRSPL
jgi:isopentenyl-diphosphate delta-isomerase